MSESPGLGQFAAPPRAIGTSLAARILLGNRTSQIGWLILGLGSIFFWVFAWHADISGWRFRAGWVGYTNGEWLDCRDTGLSEGGTEDTPGVPIYENRYRYAVADRLLVGSSFAASQCPGGRVAVEYLLTRPEVSRIVGMRRRPFSPWAALAAVIPAVGVGMILTAFVAGRANLRLLRDGLPATGRLIDTTRTNVGVNDRQVYRMTFEYTSRSGITGRAVTRTNRPERLAGEGGQLLLYDPADLRRAVLLASLPGTIAADETGQPVARGTKAYLLAPALTIVGNAWYVYRHWLMGR